MLVNIEQEVSEINNLKLFKTYLGMDEFRRDYSPYPEEWTEAFYYDEDGLIRKSYHSFISFPDKGFFIRYYDNEGFCICDYMVSYEDYEIRRLFNRRELVYADYIHYVESDLKEHVIRFGGYGLEIPTARSFSNNLILTTEQLLDISTLYGILDLTMPEFDAGRYVSFTSPVSGEKSFINSNGVMLFTDPAGYIIPNIILNVGHEVEILDTQAEWFKIKTGDCEGYVKKKYVEPVERAITE